MKLPTFLIIGAAKAGTTSLYNYLKVHPQVYMSPVKETNFFALDGKGLEAYWQGYALDPFASSTHAIDTWDKYQLLYQRANGARAIGEASPAYLYVPQVPHRIRHYLPDVKLVAVLRNPVDRAYSHYIYYRRDGREQQVDFLKALDEEEQRIRQGQVATWSYKQMGYYHALLKPYYELFDPAQIRVYLFEELRADPAALLADLSAFLEIDMAPGGDHLERHNASGLPRSRWLQRLLVRNNVIKKILKPLLSEHQKQRLLASVQQLNLTRAPAMPSEARARLVEEYRDDILRLQELIGKDVSHWLKV